MLNHISNNSRSFNPIPGLFKGRGFSTYNLLHFARAALFSAFLLMLFYPAGSFAQSGAASVASKIDFGVNIFTPHFKFEEIDFKAVKKVLESDTKNLPVRAYVLYTYVNNIAGGTKAINESAFELEKLLSFVLLRYDPQISATCFDRGYLYMIIAGLGYQNYNNRIYALMALCDMAALLQMEPLNPYYHLFYTVVYASLKDQDIAEFKLYDPLEELKKALSFDVSDPQFHYIVGSTFLAVAQASPDIHQLAYAEFMQSVKLAPKNKALKEKVFKNLIELLSDYDARKVKKPLWLEESAYLYLIEKNQDSAAAHNNLGYLYTMNNIKLDAGLAHCKKAIALDPNNPVYLHSLGCAYYKNRDIKKAVDTLKKAYSLNPELKEVHEHLSEIYLQLNDNDSAIKHLEYMLAQDTSDALINNNYSYVLAEANQKLDTSLKCAEFAVAAEGENAIYLDTLAWAYFKNNMLKEAFEVIERAVKIDPALGALYMHKGDFLFYDDKINEALENYNRGYLLDQAFPGAAENISMLNSIKLMRAKLDSLKKTYPKVSEAVCVDEKGVRRPFSYTEYTYYFHKLFEQLGFAPVTFDQLLSEQKKKALPIDISADADAKTGAAHPKTAPIKKKLLNDESSIGEELLKFMNTTGEVIFYDKTFEVILKATSENMIDKKEGTTSENTINKKNETAPAAPDDGGSKNNKDSGEVKINAK
jgi:tetratricopeptide (TPR) repeat protein